jgi:hypothetical protein
MSQKKSKATPKVTNCETCGKVLSYTTKKPKYCKEHQPGKQYRHTTKSSRNTHLFERSVFKIIEEVLICDAVRNGYHTWLKSPKGEPLQLDWYCNCGVEVAFEIQGEQHFKWIKYFHKTYADFEYQVLCDRIKDDECRKRGVYLFKINYGTKVNLEYILALLRANNCFIELVRRGAVKKKHVEKE